MLQEADLKEKQDEMKVLKLDLEELDLQIEHAKEIEDSASIREAESKKKDLIIYMSSLDVEIKQLSAVLKQEEIPDDDDEDRGAESEDTGSTGTLGEVAEDN